MEFKELNITSDQLQAVQNTASNHLRFSQVSTDILEANGNTLTVRVKQNRKVSDRVFTPQELIKMGKDVFAQLGDQYKIQYRPVVFSGEGLEAVSAKWVREHLKMFGMTQKDLCDELMIDKHVMSKLLSNEFVFTRWHQAAMWFYFLYKKTIKK